MGSMLHFLLALALTALGLLGFMLALIILVFSKPKFVVALILSLILIGLGGYSGYRILNGNQNVNPFGVQPVNTPAVEIPAVPASSSTGPETTTAPNTEITITLDIQGVRKELRDGERLAVKKGTKLKIIDGVAPGQSSKSIRINFAGFIGDPNNPAQDRGYTIDTSALLKKFAVDPKGRTYKIELLVGKKALGTVFIDLT